MAGEDGGKAGVSGSLLIRLTVLLIAAWSVAAGLAMTVFSGGGAGALAAGVGDAAGQRLAGVQMLVLAPLHLLISLKPRRYGMLLWAPFFGQASVASSVGYSILAGDTDTLDGLPVAAISGMLAALLGFLWVSEQRSSARDQYAEQQPGESSPDDFDEP